MVSEVRKAIPSAVAIEGRYQRIARRTRPPTSQELPHDQAWTSAKANEPQIRMRP